MALARLARAHFVCFKRLCGRRRFGCVLEVETTGCGCWREVLEATIGVKMKFCTRCTRTCLQDVYSCSHICFCRRRRGTKIETNIDTCDDPGEACCSRICCHPKESSALHRISTTAPMNTSVICRRPSPVIKNLRRRCCSNYQTHNLCCYVMLLPLLPCLYTPQ